MYSMSLSRLESTIEPMAEKVAGIHDKLTGDLDLKIAEILNLMQTMMSIDASPRILASYDDNAAFRQLVWPTDAKKRRTDSTSALNSVIQRPESDVYGTPLKTPELPDSGLSPKSLEPSFSRDLDIYDHQGLGLIPVEKPTRVRSFDEAPPVYDREWRPPVDGSPPTPISLARPNSLRSSQSEYSHVHQEHFATQPSVNSRPLMERSLRSSIASSSYPISQLSPEASPTVPSMLPLPMIPLEPPAQTAQPDIYDPLYVPKLIIAPDLNHRATATEMEQELFERELTRDSAILCEA